MRAGGPADRFQNRRNGRQIRIGKIPSLHGGGYAVWFYTGNPDFTDDVTIILRPITDQTYWRLYRCMGLPDYVKYGRKAYKSQLRAEQAVALDIARIHVEPNPHHPDVFDFDGFSALYPEEVPF